MAAKRRTEPGVPRTFAETVLIDPSGACTGHDRHELGYSMRTRLVMVALGLGIGTVSACWVTSQNLALLALPGALGLGLLIGACIGQSLDGDQSRFSFLGWSRSTSLSQVTRVAHTNVYGSEMLRLFCGQRRCRSIALHARFITLSRSARSHLAHWLNRSEVVWEPEARLALGVDGERLIGRDVAAGDLPPVVAHAGAFIGTWGVMVGLLGIGLGAAIVAAPGAAAPPIGVAVALASGVLGYRMVRVQAQADAEGLRIRGVRGSRSVPWQDIASVRRRPASFWTSLVMRPGPGERVEIAMSDGSCVRSLALLRQAGDPKLEDFEEFCKANVRDVDHSPQPQGAKPGAALPRDG